MSNGEDKRRRKENYQSELQNPLLLNALGLLLLPAAAGPLS